MSQEIHDLIIIGGGISAHTAGIYASRAELKPLVLSGIDPDQLSLTTMVENWPGNPDGILGPDLINNTKKQAEKFGTKYLLEKAQSFALVEDKYEIKTNNNSYLTRSVIICTGAHARKLEVPGEAEYFGKGVSTCAVCDAAFYKNKTAVVVGGGDAAMEEVAALYKFATHITLIHRKDTFNASKPMQKRIMSMKDKVDILWNTQVKEIVGDGKLVTGVKIVNSKTGEEKEVPTNGLFLAIGHLPNTDIFQGSINLDKAGYIITDKIQQTNLPGVYAAGDVQDYIFRQAITSAGSGAAAAISAEKYIEHLKAVDKY